MKPFNLNEYLANPRRVVTRNGIPVRIICTDFNDKDFPVVGEIKGSPFPELFTKEGEYTLTTESSNDLFFATKKCEGWINIFKYNFGKPFIRDMHIFETKEEAEESAKNDRTYVKSIKIEWEE